MDPEQALQRLAHAGIVERHGAEWRTTPRWERALMRAETRMVEYAEGSDDPRLPIGYALVELVGPGVAEPDLQAMVDALVPLELAEEEALEPELEP